MELELSVKHGLYLSPILLQSMEILQMTAQELSEYIDSQLQENPVLERVESCKNKSGQNTHMPISGGFPDDFSRLENLPSYTEESLQDHLMAQIKEVSETPGIYKGAKYIIYALSDSGYLEESLEEISKKTKLPYEILEKSLSLVQGLEPAGIAARNLSESLCLQLRRMNETGLPFVIAEKYLPAVAVGKYNDMAKKLFASVEDIVSACEIIRSLDPRPGSAFSGQKRTEYIIPDIEVYRNENGLNIKINDSFLPTLGIDEYYRELYRISTDPEVKNYLSPHLNRARWLIHSIAQREKTLMTCMSLILSLQEEFFLRGPGYLKPMTLSIIAEKAGVHESTVSRALRGKYLRCDFGIMPISRLFTRSVGESGVSRERVKAIIAELVASEDGKKPLSDQKICQILGEQGIEISRRAVNKYRCELGIPSTHVRRSRDTE